MTGFASAQGQGEGFSWVWDIRSVNARGLDIRTRLPDWIEGLEAAVRAAITGAATRGNVQVSLRLTRDESAADMTLNAGALNSALEILAEIENAALAKGVSVTAPSLAEVMGLRGVTEQGAAQTDTAPLLKALKGDIGPLMNSFAAMRAGEGAALGDVLAGQITRIEELTEAAATEAEARRGQLAETLRANVTKLLESAEGLDEGRIAQELALLAVKSDVTEEIDRLRAHVTAARGLLATGGAVGRKLDFLTQEFNREANTLCSKAGAPGLTAIGLDLKHVIDQMREQVQNVE